MKKGIEFPVEDCIVVMEINGGGDEEEFGFSRNYFLAKELGGSGKKSDRKLSDIDIVDEQVGGTWPS